MSLPYRVTLQGFSAFERSALGSYFRLAANRSPAYEQVETMAEAQFLIVDADHSEALRLVRAAGRVHDGVFIGAQAPDGASAWMMRPIDPLHVLRELDAMVASAQAHQRPLLPAAGDAGTATLSLPARGPTLPTRQGPVPARRASDSEGTGFVGVPDLPGPAPSRSTPRSARALLVDDSEIALRFLHTRLQRLGLRIELAASSARAIELLAHKAYDFVFLDVDLGPASEMDGLSLCQHIKRQHHHVGGDQPPVVLLVSAFHSEVDRARGALAGADGYLGKPLDENALLKLLVQNGFTPLAAGGLPAKA